MVQCLGVHVGVLLAALLLLAPAAHGWMPALPRSGAGGSKTTNHDSLPDLEQHDENSVSQRRHFLASLVAAPVTLSLLAAPSEAAIDVSSIRVDGGGSSGTGSLADQLKAYDGSGSTRVQEIKKLSTVSTSTPSPIVGARSSSSMEDPSSSVATWAYRRSNVERRLTRLNFGTFNRYEDRLVGPSSRSVYVSLDFPFDWLELDKTNQGIQYVDQRNGDKLYVFRARLPPDTTIETVPKSFFGDALFDPKSSLSLSGTTIEDYKISSSKDLSIANARQRRRLKAKYATVTGNGLRVERRGLIDAYELDGTVYMLLTSCSAVAFEANGPQRETVERIADSFVIEAM